MSMDDNVLYLENEDFDGDGNLLYRPNKPIVCLAYADFCGHCIALKPAFTEFTNKMKDNVSIVCIQGDSKIPSVQNLMKRLQSIIPGFGGFPTICKFDGNTGKYLKTYEGDRSVNSFIDFSN